MDDVTDDDIAAAVAAWDRADADTDADADRQSENES